MKVSFWVLASLLLQVVPVQGQDLVWARQVGSPSGATGFGVAVDGSGNVYTTGSFGGTADFDPGVGVFNLTSAGDQDIFVLKLDSAGNFVWVRQMGGTARLKSGKGVAVDDSGNVYAMGYFEGAVDFAPGPSVFTLTSVGAQDIFVSKLDSAGIFVWAQQLGGAASRGPSGTTSPWTAAFGTTGNARAST